MLLPPGSAAVVVVAGLPGAGKTTLTRGEPRALDSDALRERWRVRLGRLPYRLWPWMRRRRRRGPASAPADG